MLKTRKKVEEEGGGGGEGRCQSHDLLVGESLGDSSVQFVHLCLQFLSLLLRRKMTVVFLGLHLCEKERGPREK